MGVLFPGVGVLFSNVVVVSRCGVLFLSVRCVVSRVGMLFPSVGCVVSRCWVLSLVWGVIP